MMSSTLDILLMNDPSSGMDKTGEWESQLDHRIGPKIKFPLKMKEESLSDLETDFNDPVIHKPVKKKPELNKEAKVISTGKKKKDNKSKLF